MANTSPKTATLIERISPMLAAAVILAVGGFGYSAKTKADGNEREIASEARARVVADENLSQRVDREVVRLQQQLSDLKVQLSQQSANINARFDKIDDGFKELRAILAKEKDR